jgi:hypothetical protein
VCQALADAADRLPNLAHISLGMELDALLSSHQAAGVSPLSGLTQLTSLAFVEYQVGPASRTLPTRVANCAIRPLRYPIYHSADSSTAAALLDPGGKGCCDLCSGRACKAF